MVDVVAARVVRWVDIALAVAELGRAAVVRVAERLRRADRAVLSHVAALVQAQYYSAPGQVLEAVINGRYYWVPFSRVAELTTEPPEDLRDLGEQPVGIETHGQFGSKGFEEPDVTVSELTGANPVAGDQNADSALVDEGVLRAAGAHGIMRTGATVQVPLFITTGERIKVDTRDSS